MTTKLIKDLEELLNEKTEDNKQIEIILENAKKYLYDDFRSTVATPRIKLHEDLLKAKLYRLVKNNINGKYDN